MRQNQSGVEVRMTFLGLNIHYFSIISLGFYIFQNILRGFKILACINLILLIETKVCTLIHGLYLGVVSCSVFFGGML